MSETRAPSQPTTEAPVAEPAPTETPAAQPTEWPVAPAARRRVDAGRRD